MVGASGSDQITVSLAVKLKIRKRGFLRADRVSSATTPFAAAVAVITTDVGRSALTLSELVLTTTVKTDPNERTRVSQPDAAAGEVDRERKRLRVVTQETRFALLQDVLGHSRELPTLKELDYVNPSKSDSTIRGHLDALVDAGVLERVELPPERRSRDLPHVFYGITAEGQEFLDRHGLLRARETLRDVYDAVEKTDEIERYECAPRPER